MNISIHSFIDKWKSKRAERLRQQKLKDELFERFLVETQPLTPKATQHPKAVLYRHAWKRAVALSYIFDKIKNTEKSELYKNFALSAARGYKQVAPSNLYGEVRLKFSHEAFIKQIEKELRTSYADIDDDTFTEKFNFKL